MEDGSIVEGEGQDAPAGMKLSELAADAVHARFVHPGGTEVFVFGPVVLHWTIQNVLSYGDKSKDKRHVLCPHSKALSLRSSYEHAKVFVMPDGTVGIGRTVEDCGAAYRAFAIAYGRRGCPTAN